MGTSIEEITLWFDVSHKRPTNNNKSHVMEDIELIHSLLVCRELIAQPYLYCMIPHSPFLSIHQFWLDCLHIEPFNPEHVNVSKQTT